jgi:hypothetical protein
VPGAGAGNDVVAPPDAVSEQVVLIQSVTETNVPKLVADDVPLLVGLVALGLSCLPSTQAVRLVFSLVPSPRAS